jgi:hypothetical protein
MKTASPVQASVTVLGNALHLLSCGQGARVSSGRVVVGYSPTMAMPLSS